MSEARDPIKREPNGDKDCFTCKAIGTLTFSSLSAYSIYLRATTPKTDKGHRLYLGVMALGFGGVAIARAFY